MIRSMWLPCCALVALMLAPLVADAQDEADIFAPVDPAAAGNPFGQGAPAAASVTEKSVLAGARLEPAAAQVAHQDVCKCIGETDSEAVARIEQALRSKLTSAGLDFADTPLEEVVAFIQETYNIPVQLDTPALDEIGLGADEPVTINVHSISLRSALRLLLKQLQLTYVINDEVLMITTPEEAESQLTICVYDVRDLVDGPKDAAGVEALIDTIVRTVNTDTWAVNGGGVAAIRSLSSGLIVVSQTRAVHEQVRGLLQTIRHVQIKGPAAENGAGKSAAANIDPDKVLTKAYFLSRGEAADDEIVRQQIRNLIEGAIPDVRWEGRLRGGEAVLLTVLPDRIILKNKLSVHDQVEELLIDSELTTAPASGGRIGGGGFGAGDGGFGGGGGGFFRPRSGD